MSPAQITDLSSRHVKVIYLSLALKIRRLLNRTRFQRRRWPVKVSQDSVVTHFSYNSPWRGELLHGEPKKIGRRASPKTTMRYCYHNDTLWAQTSGRSRTRHGRGRDARMWSAHCFRIIPPATRTTLMPRGQRHPLQQPTHRSRPPSIFRSILWNGFDYCTHHFLTSGHLEHYLPRLRAGLKS